MNRNVRLIKEVAAEFGATVELDEGRQKHQRYTVILPDGTTVTHSVSQGLRNDPFKIKQWARQRIRQAMKAHNSNGSV